MLVGAFLGPLVAAMLPSSPDLAAQAPNQEAAGRVSGLGIFAITVWRLALGAGVGIAAGGAAAVLLTVVLGRVGGRYLIRKDNVDGQK